MVIFMSEKEKRNPFKGIVNYFKEVRAELKKVVWPSFKQIKNNTIIVIISLIFVGAIIFVIDLGFKAGFENLVGTTEQTLPGIEAPEVPNASVPGTTNE